MRESGHETHRLVVGTHTRTRTHTHTHTQTGGTMPLIPKETYNTYVYQTSVIHILPKETYNTYVYQTSVIHILHNIAVSCLQDPHKNVTIQKRTLFRTLHT